MAKLSPLCVWGVNFEMWNFVMEIIAHAIMANDPADKGISLHAYMGVQVYAGALSSDGNFALKNCLVSASVFLYLQVADRINMNNYISAPRTPPAMQKRIDQLREMRASSNKSKPGTSTSEYNLNKLRV